MGWSVVCRCLGWPGIEPLGSLLGSFTWKKIEPKGKGPCPRRRQCCCIVGDKIVLFGGTRLGGGGLRKGLHVTYAGGIWVRVWVQFQYLLFPLFHWHSPSPEEGLGDEFDLIDHSDLHILDFSKYLFLKCFYCQVLFLWVVTRMGPFPALTVLQLLL